MYDKISDFIKKELTNLDNRAASDGRLSLQEMQYVDLLAHVKKSLLTNEAMEGNKKGNSYNDGYSKGYNDGYNSRNESYGARGRGARRDSMGRYADEPHAGYQDDMISDLHSLMENAPNEQMKHKLEEFIYEVERLN